MVQVVQWVSSRGHWHWILFAWLQGLDQQEKSDQAPRSSSSLMRLWAHGSLLLSTQVPLPKVEEGGQI